MAIKKCKECSHPVSSKAEACPNCGAVLKRKSSCLGLIVSLILIFIILGIVMSIIANPSGSSSSRRSSDSSTSSTSTDQITPQNQESAPKSNIWRYDHNNYSMSKGRIHRAITQSVNSVNFGFPYAGDQRGLLTVRTHPKYGKDIILSIDRGQFLVRSYEDSKALVRFDDSEPITFKVVGSEDHSATNVFFRDYHGFIKRMMRSKRVRISVPVYKEGSPVFEFNVQKFDADKYLEKK